MKRLLIALALIMCCSVANAQLLAEWYARGGDTAFYWTNTSVFVLDMTSTVNQADGDLEGDQSYDGTHPALFPSVNRPLAVAAVGTRKNIYDFNSRQFLIKNDLTNYSDTVSFMMVIDTAAQANRNSPEMFVCGNNGTINAGLTWMPWDNKNFRFDLTPAGASKQELENVATWIIGPMDHIAATWSTNTKVMTVWWNGKESWTKDVSSLTGHVDLSAYKFGIATDEGGAVGGRSYFGGARLYAVTKGDDFVEYGQDKVQEDLYSRYNFLGLTDWQCANTNIIKHAELMFTHDGQDTTVVWDSSFSRNTGTENGGVALTTEGGASRTSLVYQLYDGVDDRINANTVRADIDTDDVGSFSAWIKPLGNTNQLQCVMSINDSDQDQVGGLWLTNGSLQAKFRTGGTDQWNLKQEASLATAVWHHVMVSQDGTVVRMYLNGAIAANVTTGGADNTTWWADAGTAWDNVQMGCDNYNSAGLDNWFEGGIDDEFVFTNTAFSEAAADYFASNKLIRGYTP